MTTGIDKAEIPPSGAIDAAWAALRSVYDPEHYLDAVSLGLVVDIRGEDGTIVVEMASTTTGCLDFGNFPVMAQTVMAESVANSEDIDIRIVWEPPYTPALNNEGAAARRGRDRSLIPNVLRAGH